MSGNARNVRLLFLAVFVGAGFLSHAQAATAPEIARDAFPSVVKIVMLDSRGRNLSLGSGFFVTKDVVATNAHVIEGASTGYANVVGQKSKHRIVGIVALDLERDLALIKLEGADAPPLPLGESDLVNTGEDIYVLGNPQGLEGTFSKGNVSSVRKLPKGYFLQITAPISAGSSGGPVLNSDGEVVGVAVAQLKEGQNLNFAIPSSYVRSLVDNIGPVRPLALGNRSNEVGKAFSDSVGKPRAEGDSADVPVSRLSPESQGLYRQHKYKFAFVDGEYVRLPKFDLLYRNSREGARLPKAARYTTEYVTEYVTVRDGPTRTEGTGIHTRKFQPYKTVRRTMPKMVPLPASKIREIEAHWKTGLPAVNVGEFGIWPWNEELTVLHILGPDDMLVTGGGRIIRLKGWPTGKGWSDTWQRNVRADTPSAAPLADSGSLDASKIKINMAIIAESPLEGFGDKPILLAIPMERVRDGLSENQFADLMQKHPDLLGIAQEETEKETEIEQQGDTPQDKQDSAS